MSITDEFVHASALLPRAPGVLHRLDRSRRLAAVVGSLVEAADHLDDAEVAAARIALEDAAAALERYLGEVE